jgi:hypothetical protein
VASLPGPMSNDLIIAQQADQLQAARDQRQEMAPRSLTRVVRRGVRYEEGPSYLNPAASLQPIA